MLKVLAALGLAAVAVATPLWQPHLAHASIGRNIRHLPCVSRRSGETGTCMFAFSCAKANGTHLGTCIDRFYFGSCCRLPELEEPVDIDAVPPIEDNFLDGTTTTRIRPAVTQKPSTPTTPGQPQPTVPSISAAKPTTVAPTLVTWTTVEESSGKPSVPASIRPQVSPGSAGTHRPVVGSTTQTSASSSRPPTATSSPTYVSSVTPSLPSTQRPPPTHGPMSSPLVGVTTPQPTPSIAPVSSLRPPVSTHRPVSVVTLPSSSAAPSAQTTHGVSFQPVSTQRPPPPSSSGRPPSSSARPPTPSSARPPSSPSKPSSPSSVRPTASTLRPTPSSSRPPASTSRPPASSSRPPASTSRPPASSSRPPASTPRPPASTSRPPPSSTRPQVATSRPTPSPPRPPSSTSRPPPTPSRPPSSSSRPPAGTSKPPQGTQKPRPPSGATSKPKPTQRPTSKPGVKPKPTPKPKPPAKPIAPTKPTVPTARPTTRPTTPVTTNATTATPLTSSTAQKPASETWVPVSVSTHAPSTALPTDKTPTSTTTKPQPTQEATTTSSDGTISTTTSSAPGSNGSLPSTTTAGPSLTQHLNMTNYREVCGRRLFPESRVVGGDKSSFGKWPWQISLRQWRTSTYLHKCGAALLNENWAITAAHCVENVPPSDLLLRLGEHDLSVEDEPYGYQERRVQIVASHPQFDPRTFEYDLALLRFYEPVVFQPNIIPICVPDDDLNFVGTTAYVTGWGRLYEDGPLPSVLQEVSVPVINNSLCETMYRAAGYIEHIPDIFICAGWKKGGFDSCEGDSGGPMVIQRPDRRWLLAGVISWGIGCAEPNQPGVYTRISQFRDWINQILQF